MASYNSGGGYYQQPMMGATPVMGGGVSSTPMMSTPVMPVGAPMMGTPMMGTPVMAPGVGMAPMMGTPVVAPQVMPVMPVGAPMMGTPMVPGGMRGVPGCMKCMGTGMKMSKKWGQMKPCKSCMRMLGVPGYY